MVITMNYIKGTYIKEIFSNATNGYVVGIIKVIESDVKDIDIIDPKIKLKCLAHVKSLEKVIDILKEMKN